MQKGEKINAKYKIKTHKGIINFKISDLFYTWLS